MHIALNAQLLSAQSGYRNAGVSNYSRHLLLALGQLAQCKVTPHRLSAFVHTPAFAAPGVELRLSTPALERPALRIAWEQTVLPAQLQGMRADLVHGLVNVLPLATPVPGVVTVHDLSFLQMPELFPPVKRAYLTALCRASVARAAQVIAVSQQTAADLARFWGIAASRLQVAPNGVDARFTPGDAAQLATWRQAQHLPARYWLYVGTLEPRKNLPLLLKAFARWRQIANAANSADPAVHLVLAGGKGWYYETIFGRVAELGLTEVVHFPGFVPDADLPNWYRAAELFVYPSRFEGFGLPVVEAMACGTPVLCSHAPGVREVAGRAAILVSPDDVDAWVHGMTLLASQPQLREQLRAQGIAHARHYTWQAAAEATLHAYERAAAHADKK